MAYVDDIITDINCSCPSDIPNDTFKRYVLALLGATATNPGIPITLPTVGTTTPTTTVATGAGSTAANAQAVSVTNAGNSAGSFNGQTIPSGQTVSLTAYLDPVTNVYKRLTAIAYDGTGTSLYITVTP